MGPGHDGFCLRTTQNPTESRLCLGHRRLSSQGRSLRVNTATPTSQKPYDR